MMKVLLTKRFIKELKSLPNSTQNKLADVIDVLKIDPFNPTLHTKRLHPPLTGILSFRIGHYRALFVFESKEEIKLIRIQHRKDIYKKL